MINESDETRPIATMEQASVYFAGRRRADAWTNATETERGAALYWASLTLDSAFVFNERASTRDANGAVVWNERIVAAVCEQALWGLRLDPGVYPEIVALGIAQVALAGVSASFNAKNIAPILSPIARRLVGDLGAFIADDERAGGSFTSTPLAL